MSSRHSSRSSLGSSRLYRRSRVERLEYKYIKANSRHLEPVTSTLLANAKTRSRSTYLGYVTHVFLSQARTRLHACMGSCFSAPYFGSTGLRCARMAKPAESPTPRTSRTPWTSICKLAPKAHGHQSATLPPKPMDIRNTTDMNLLTYPCPSHRHPSSRQHAACSNCSPSGASCGSQRLLQTSGTLSSPPAP